MSSKWHKETLLSECASFQEGYVNPSQLDVSYFGNDVKWLRATDLNDGFVFETSRRLSKKGFESAGKSATLFEPGSLAISKSGTIGRIGILKDYMCGNRAVINIKPNSSCDYRFIFYTLLLNRQRIETLAEGSVQKNLYVSALGSLRIELPPINEQMKISSVLGALDDRIALLRDTNATLEALSQAMFKSWFVDFDPVRAKQEDRDPEGMDDATAALFPDSFEESELGLVPRGWKWVNLDAIALVTMGLSPKGDSYNFDGIGIPLINGPVEFGEYFPVQTKWTNMASKFANEGDLIFCVRGSTTGRRVVSDREYCIGRGVCAIRGNNDSANFIYQTINFGIERLLNKTTGSVFPSLSGPDIKTFKVLNPTEVLINAYENTTKSILLRIKENHRQTQVLENLRDTLLPRLISGQLRLPEAASLLEQIAA